MAEPIRVLHFADVHIGMENYGRLDPASGTSTRVRDFLDRLDEVIDYALANEVDLAVFAGDAFKNRDPEQTQQREFAQRIKRLTDVVPTLLLVGNHDMPGMVAKASSLDIFKALKVPRAILGDKAEGRVVETRRGPLYLAWMPYPMRNRLLARQENQGKSLHELEIALREAVSLILRQLALEAGQHAMPRLLAGHFSVAEAKLGSERSVMLGRDVAVTSSVLADPAWDYIALGHIHRHQVLNGAGYPPIVYSGSLERIDFGEEGEAKGFCWVELQRGATQWSFHQVAARPFKTIRLDVRHENDPTQAAVDVLKDQAVEGAVVRVQIQMLASQQAQLREGEIGAALAQASSVTLSPQVEVESRGRLEERAAEALTPLELLEHYFRTKDEPPERIEALLASAEELMSDSD
jgi:exonuclease SbcD